MTPPIRNFIKDGRAVIAIEFALVVPILAMIWFGVVEFGSAHLVARKVEVAAQAVADLVAQETETNVAELTDLEEAIKTMLAPFPTTDDAANDIYGYSITSVETDDVGTASVGWHRAGGTLAASTGTAAGLPTGLVSTSDSVIVVTVSYSHVPWAARYFVAKGDFALSETMYAKPRLVSTIPCTDCP